MSTAINLDKLDEWGDFAPKHLKQANGKAPTRRVGKRLILANEIPGRILDGKPWVYTMRYLLGETNQSTNDTTTAALALLNG